MRRGPKSRLPVALAAAAVLLGSCGGAHRAATPTTAAIVATSSTSSTTTSTMPPDTTSTTSTSSTTTTTTARATTTTTIPTGWTERELLGQLIMVGALYSDPAASAGVVRDGVGGLVFFGQPSAASGPAIAAGVADLNRAATVPPLMATDEEGGGVARLSNLVGALPWPRQMASLWTPAQLTARLASVGSAMRSLGMNMDLAPVVDTASPDDTIDLENLRSFSDVGSTAAADGLAFVKGLAQAGVIGVFKHFPGLGHASGNTDLGAASDPPLADLAARDLVPFQKAITAGVRVVMMSNVTEPDWGSTPASLNGAAYEYLRQMGYSGVILTDSLNAGSISAAGLNGADAVVRAIEAGADMAMITTASDYQGALAGLEAAVASGALPIAQVVRSVDRIVTLKNSTLPTGKALTPPT